MYIYHFALDSGWECDNWITVSDSVENAKEKIITQFITMYGEDNNIEYFKNRLDKAEIYLMSIYEVVNIHQSFD